MSNSYGRGGPVAAGKNTADPLSGTGKFSALAQRSQVRAAASAAAAAGLTGIMKPTPMAR